MNSPEPLPGHADPGLCLVVLKGLHSGAVVELPAMSEADGPATLSIGSDLDHDIVLADAPSSARLTRTDVGWQWSEEGFTQLVGDLGRWRWGPMELAIGPPASRWDAFGLKFDRSVIKASDNSAIGHESSSEPAPRDEAIAASSPTSDIPSGATAEAAARTASRKPSRGLQAALLAGCLVVVAGVWLVLRADRSPAPIAVKAVSESTPAESPSASAVARLIAEAGFADQVRVIAQPDGRVRLIGVVALYEDLDRLLGQVSKLTRRIVQGVLTQAEFISRLQEIQADAPFPVSLRGAPVGRVLVIDDESVRAGESRLRAWLQKALPEASQLELVAAGAPELRVASEAVPDGSPAALPELAPDEPPYPPLPNIRLVVGGNNPYIMLASGEKWLPGGRVGGWVLNGVEASAFVIEDTRGRSVRNPR
jgi:hypothetical protein